jgi:(1->4)-alpha-D-glucan 1-alpha-D-glucosylmutase
MAELFTHGGYEPLRVTGSQADRIVAFRRAQEGQAVTVIVGRHLAGLQRHEPAWGDTAVHMEARTLRNVFDGCAIGTSSGSVPTANALRHLPVAAFVEE